ncbi:hypothetical protein V1460_17300 [Streptomyces sp. SCSIO 30461]|uniref:hypothetical protein n=1 Tax=Streptomyces sp. SCSIO 30461 TaxID=3118085 RepID=UPI0030CE60C1
MWAGLIVYQLLRRVMTDAALAREGADPDRMSFTVALECARDQVALASGIEYTGLTADGTIDAAVLESPMPPRRLRVSALKVKCSTSRYASRAYDERSTTSMNVTNLAIDIHDGHVPFAIPETPAPAGGGPHPSSQVSRREQVIQLLLTHPARSWTAREIAYALGYPKHKVIAGQLYQWAITGVLERTAPGTYTVAPAWTDPAHPGRAGHTSKERTIALLRANPDRSWKAREIIDALEYPPARHRGLVNELCRWVRDGILERTSPGSYKLPNPIDLTCGVSA